MVLGTAGFTAALSLYRAKQNGVSPAMGAMLVTGATGGVGATRIAIAKQAGYRVVASTRKYVPHLLPRLEYGGVIAISGYTGGPDFTARVFPFLRRQAAIIRIDSVWLDMETRREIWRRLAGPWRPSDEVLRQIGHDITLDDLDSALKQILAGRMQGRAVVNL